MDYKIIFMVIFIVCVGCTFTAPIQEKTPSETQDDIIDTRPIEGYIEITENNIFEIDNITAESIQVLGLRLGDSGDEMLEIFGEPDLIAGYKENTIVNCEYGESLGLEDIGLIVQVKYEVVTRITVLSPMLPLLENGSDFSGWDKIRIYSQRGLPDKQYEEPDTRIFFYDESGIDMLLLKSDMKGFSLRLPEKPAKLVPLDL